MNTWLLLSVTMLFTGPPCDCPSQASLPTRIVSNHGFVVCGHEESRTDGAYMIDEYQVFACGDGEAIASGGVLDQARLEVQHDRLVLTQTTRWPAGEGWAWVDLPYMRITFGPGKKAPVREVLPVVKKLSDAEVEAVIHMYEVVVTQDPGEVSGEDIENLIGRLVVGALVQEPTLAGLFHRLPSEYELDGHSGETYSEGEENFGKSGGCRVKSRLTNSCSRPRPAVPVSLHGKLSLRALAAERQGR